MERFGEVFCITLFITYCDCLGTRPNKRGAYIDLRHAIDKIPNHGTLNHFLTCFLNYSCGVIFSPVLPPTT